MRTSAAGAWQARADQLAAWAWQRLVNRTDCRGAYSPRERRGQVYTRADGKQATVPISYTLKRQLSLEELARHFRGERPEHVLGLHPTGLDNSCRWGAFDIDRHDEQTDPRETLRLAYALYDQLRNLRLTPL